MNNATLLQCYNTCEPTELIVYIVYANDKYGDYAFGYFPSKADAKGYMVNNYPSLNDYSIVGVTQV